MSKNKALNKILLIYYNCNNFRKIYWYHHSIKETFVKNFALITTVNQELFSKSSSSLLLSPTTPGRPSGEFIISFSAVSHLLLSVYSSSGSPHLHFCPSLAVSFKSGFWYFPSLRNCDFLPCHNLPLIPSPFPSSSRTTPGYVSKIHLSSSTIFYPHLCLNCEQKTKKAKISDWNVSVEEAKPQHDPPTVSSLFLKFHFQLSVKFRTFSLCSGQLRVRSSRLAQEAPWNSHFTAKAGVDRWTDTNGDTQHTPSSCQPALAPVHPAMGDFTGTGYGNYSGREGISASSRLENNSWFTKHKVQFTSRAGFEQESTEAREAVPAFAKTQEKVRKLKDSELFCPTTCHARSTFLKNIKAPSKLTDQSDF